jgi:hypothetical protein
MFQTDMSSKPSETVDLLAAFLTRHFVALHVVLVFLVAASGKTFNSAFISSFSIFSVPDPDWIRIQWGPRIRIQIRIRNPDPDLGGQKLSTNIEKSRVADPDLDPN